MKNNATINVLGVPVHPFTMHEAVSFLLDRVEKQLTTNVITANAEIIMLGLRNTRYFEILHKADCVLPDGAGTVWAGRTLGYQVPERVAGFDLFQELLKIGHSKNLRFYFFGASPDVARQAKEKCEKLYPGISIVGYHHGYFTPEETQSIVEDINDSGANILCVALGAPKQEFWLAENAAQLQPVIRIGLGGSLDALIGKVARAPQWMQKASLEWLFRLYNQPIRIWRMMVLQKYFLQVFSTKY